MDVSLKWIHRPLCIIWNKRVGDRLSLASKGTLYSFTMHLHVKWLGEKMKKKTCDICDNRTIYSSCSCFSSSFLYPRKPNLCGTILFQMKELISLIFQKIEKHKKIIKHNTIKMRKKSGRFLKIFEDFLKFLDKLWRGFFHHMTGQDYRRL